MGRKKTLCVEKKTKHCYIDEFGYSMFGLCFGWRHVIMYAARKQMIIVDCFFVCLFFFFVFFFLFFFFLYSSDNGYNVFIVEYCDNLYNYNLS